MIGNSSLPPSDMPLSDSDIVPYLAAIGKRDFGQKIPKKKYIYKPFPHQVVLRDICDKKRFVIVFMGRRLGKTTELIEYITDKASNHTEPADSDRDLLARPPKFMYIAPTQAQAESIAWGYLCLAAQAKGGEVDLTRKQVVFPNGAVIMVRGAHNQGNRLRGDYLDGCVCDEYAYWSPSVWTNVLFPMLNNTLAKINGFAIFASTVCGRNHAWKLYERVRKGTEKDWGWLKVSAIEAGIPQEVLDQYRSEQGEEAYRREMLNDEDAMMEGTYFSSEIATLRKRNRLGSYAYKPDVPVFASLDLGISDSTVIWFGQVYDGMVTWVHCEEWSGKTTDYCVGVIEREKVAYGLDINSIWFPHDVSKRQDIAAYDAVDTAVAESRFDIIKRQLRKAGITGIASKIDIKTGSVSNRIPATRKVLQISRFNKDDKGINDGLAAIALYRRQWNSETMAYADKPWHDWTSDYADAFGYGCVMLNDDLHFKMQNRAAETRRRMFTKDGESTIGGIKDSFNEFENGSVVMKRPSEKSGSKERGLFKSVFGIS